MMRRINTKKGITYVEMILSFAIFISLLIAIFLYIKPIREPVLSSVLLDVAEEGLKKDATIVLTELPFKAVTQEGKCLLIEHHLDLTSELKPENVFVKITEGGDIPFDIYPTELRIDSPQSDSLISIFYSYDEEFAHQDLEPCADDAIESPTFSTPRILKFISHKKLSELVNKYNNDYENLKKEWAFPSGNDFSITITQSGPVATVAIATMAKEPPKGKNVYSRDFTLHMFRQYTDPDPFKTSIEQIDVKISVW